MASHFPIIVEREESGVFSAYVVGLPVYAQGATELKAERAIRSTLMAYLEAHPDTPASTARVRIAAVRTPFVGGGKPFVALKSAAALLGASTSRRKTAAARATGRLGGRPRVGTTLPQKRAAKR